MRVGTWAGIGVTIHWTFWFLVLFYLVSVSIERGLLAGLGETAFVLCVFACIALHEFGHAGAAGYFGIRTLDITLLPIGGVARLERIPDQPFQELLIALAGPAVNFALAAVLLPLAMLSGTPPSVPAPPDLTVEMSFVAKVVAANLVLAVFNLLPAFPMDGGRVLRSLLAMRLGNVRATSIAARIGRWMALFFAIFGFWYQHYELMVLALFIFVAGTFELFSVRARAMAEQMQGGSGTFVWHSGNWPPSANGQPWPDFRDASLSNPSRGHDENTIDAVAVREIPDGDSRPRIQ